MKYDLAGYSFLMVKFRTKSLGYGRIKHQSFQMELLEESDLKLLNQIHVFVYGTYVCSMYHVSLYTHGCVGVCIRVG